MARKVFSILIYILLSNSSMGQDWIQVSEEFSQRITSMYHDPVSGHLFIGGQFGYLGENHVGGIVSYDGANFYDYGCAYDCEEPFTALVTGPSTFQAFNNELYMRGVSSEGWDSLVNQIPNTQGAVKLISGQFSALDEPFFSNDYISEVSTIKVIDNNLYFLSNNYGVVGGFENYGGVIYSGFDWTPLTLPYCCDYHTFSNILKFEDELYVCGNFGPEFGQVGPSDIAKYVNNEWITLDDGIAGSGLTTIYDMLIFQNELYVCGNFGRDAGNLGEGVMKWNGLEWSDLGSGIVEGEINDMVIYNDELFVCGNFNGAGSVDASNIAKWNGDRWCSIPHEFTAQNIREMVVYNEDLFVFSYTDECQGCLFRWDETVDDCEISDGVSEISAINDIYIYPNPAQENLLITLNNHSINETTVSIINLLGISILEFEVDNRSNTQIEIPVHSLKEGTYLIEIKLLNGTVINSKFIKD